MNDNEISILNEIKKQIERFDQKSSILLAISSVLLGISFGWMPIFKAMKYTSMPIWNGNPF